MRVRFVGGASVAGVVFVIFVVVLVVFVSVSVVSVVSVAVVTVGVVGAHLSVIAHTTSRIYPNFSRNIANQLFGQLTKA